MFLFDIRFWLLLLVAFFFYKLIGASSKPTKQAPTKQQTKHLRYGTVPATALQSQLYNSRVPSGYDIILSERDSAGRVVGGFMKINRKLYDKHINLIRSGSVERNDILRRHADIPGRNDVRGEVVMNGDTPIYLWHATHGLPFRYCLSDGDIDNIMFMGTSHLNSGDRPKANYFLTDKMRDDRVERLKQLCLNNMRDKGVTLKYPLADKAFNAQYSMDDLERVADNFVRMFAKSDFKYGFKCHYHGDSKIPSAVTVRLYNLTYQRLIFDITLENRH